jgi:hypothetical protein
MISLQPMQSSNIKAAGYDPERQELFIEFQTGPTYRYDKVPAALWQGLLAAPSHGKFLREAVQLKGFPYQRII